MRVLKFINKYEIFFTLIIVAIISPLVILCVNNYYTKTYYTENGIVLIEISKKETKEYTRYDATTKTSVIDHNYYFKWDEENKLEVSKSIYDKYDVGDEIIIKKIVTYKKCDDYIHSIKYELE